MKAITGLIAARGGRVVLAGEDVTGLSAHERARMGLGLVPEGRQIFPNLTVHENLVATARRRKGQAKAAHEWTLERVHDLFPELAERADAMGALLSGGEQQMLAIGRALMTNPDLLILDEATEGLAPMARARIWRTLAEVLAAGMALLVIDKNVHDLMALASRHYIMEKGRIVWQGTSPELAEETAMREKYLGV
jgi:branched-chain amino acid transport system ATP-binding protein